MPLPPGTQLGPYVLLNQIGAGGMGEVYKARDPKLDRLVAIKVLQPSPLFTGDLLARFESEAKAVAALNHPNVLGIYDYGREGEYSYAVMELLEGDSLRAKLQTGALPPKRTLEIAQQMAEGLAAAHAKGIIHRDIKPENIFLTRDGRVKVLDFGLAKQLPPKTYGAHQETILTATAGQASNNLTQPGVVLGTVSYMAPEQVRGEPADQRSDIFAFGVVLYEMLTGRQAFRKDTAVQTMAAILEVEPEALSSLGAQIPPALERLVLHCLEKDPENRFQSMKDLAYHLRNVSNVSATAVLGPRLKAPWRWFAGGLAAALLVGVALWAANRLHVGATAAPPTFQRLTFVPGTIESARFGPDGKTVYFSQRVAGEAPELFVLHPDAREPKALGIKDALLLSVSATNELAFLRAPKPVLEGLSQGLLARVSGEGGACRDLQEGVADAVWDGAGLTALGLDEGFQFRLEFPMGTQLLRGDATAKLVRHLRLSPDHEQLAFVQADRSSRTEIVLYDRKGHHRVLFTKLGDTSASTLTGLAWGPDHELWLTELQGDQTALWALSMKGRRRSLWQGAGSYQLLDVSPEGRALVAQHQTQLSVVVQKAGDPKLRDLTVTSGTQAQGLSADGRNLLLMESPSMLGGTARDEAYVRTTEGGPALRLGRGTPVTLSNNGGWVQMETGPIDAKDLDPTWIAAFQEAGLEAHRVGDPKARGRFLLFVPTGMGRPFATPVPQGHETGDAYLMPDEQQILLNVIIQGKSFWALLDRRGEKLRILTREGLGIKFIGCTPLSPDASRLIVTGDGVDWFIQPLAGGEAQPIRGLLPGELVLGWSADGTAVYLRSSWISLPVAITRLDLAGGTRKAILDFSPPEPAGHIVTLGVFMTPDAKVFAFTYGKKLSQVYLMNGVR